jgi:hypothetical protein
MIMLGGAFAQAIAADDSPLAAIYVGLSTPFIVSFLLAKAAAQFTKPGTTPPGTFDALASGDEERSRRVETYAVRALAPSIAQRLSIFARAVLR